MLSHRNKISRSEFPLFSQRKVIWRGRVLSIAFYEGKADKKTFSFIIPKKTISSAVERNRLKRSAYAHIQKHLKYFSAGKHVLSLNKKLGISKESVTESLQGDINRYISKE